MATAPAAFTPPCMNWQAQDLPDEFARFKQYCNLIFQGPYSKKADEEKASFILLWIGRCGIDIYNSWSWSEDGDKNKPAKIWEKFEKHLAPKVNHRLARYQLQQYKQKDTESVDDFLTRCRNQATKCKFRDTTEVEERLIEQLVIGTRYKKVQEKLLEKGEKLTLDTATDTARTYEATLTHMKQLTSGSEHDVHVVRSEDPKNSKKCPNCGGQHPEKPRSKCPAFGTECGNCGKTNHWARVCRSKSQNNSRPPRSTRQPKPKSHLRTPHKHSGRSPSAHRRTQHIHEMSGNDDPRNLSDHFETITFESVTINSLQSHTEQTTRDEVLVLINVNLQSSKTQRTVLKAKLDTGAQGNILPIRIYRRMFPHNLTTDGFPNPGALHQANTILTAYGGARITQYGTCTIPCEYKGTQTKATFFVTAADGPAIIGLPTSLKLKLVTLNCSLQKEAPNESPTPDTSSKRVKDKEDLIAQYPECFNGIGKFEGKYHITLDPAVPPVIHSPRRVPISMKDDIKRELDDMAAQGIIAKVKEGEPTAWVNSLVYRRKANGSLRICLDPKDLNKAIRREHHVTTTLEEILPKLSGAQVFSIVDVKCGYWNVELDEESTYLTTFNSPFGRYRFLRMPFGLKMSQDVFQAKIDQTFEGCKGVVGIADDIVVSGKTTEDHDRHMHGMMKRCKTTGLKLNPDKCKIKEEKIKFYGVICSADGVQPDPGKVSALKHMAAPSNLQELQTFLGLATYMGPFIPNLSNLTAPLREIGKKGNTFDWIPTHDTIFEKIKQSITEEVTLSYFNADKPVTLQVDASTKGLGAALLQENKPIAFASKALTDTESRYANIERELLAVVYGCERFHTYLYGRHFTTESDHKPLESIHLKHLTAAPPRLQRMLLRLQPYDLTIKYKPGKEMLLADALSRLSPEDRLPMRNLDVQIHEICPQVADSMMQKIKEETPKDPELLALKEIVYSGWPSTNKELPILVKPYWSYRDELTVEDGILMKGMRIIIPQTLQSQILAKLHEAHQGAEKTKLRARTTVFWRNLNKDIDETTKACTICQELQKTQTREPLIPTEIPPRPWHTVATDLFYLEGAEYLLIADYYSKYPFVRKIPRNDSSSRTVAEMTKQIFSEQGIPSIVRSDNGPHFVGQAYREFAQEYGFHHITSSPHYPRSNGFIESQVNAVKTALMKAKKSNRDPNIALLCLRATPVDNHLPTPAEILFNRTLQDNLPKKFRRNLASEGIINRLQQKQDTQKHYHDQCSKSLPSLTQGQKVVIQNPKTAKWEPATIVRKIEGAPRSYNVSTPTGGELRRNRSHIRSIPQESKRVKLDLEEDASPAPLRKGEDDSTATAETPPSLSRPPAQEAGSISPNNRPAPELENTTTTSDTANGQYQTRSGRAVKAPPRLDL